jgi:hypothetical protein
MSASLSNKHFSPRRLSPLAANHVQLGGILCHQ